MPERAYLRALLQQRGDLLPVVPNAAIPMSRQTLAKENMEKGAHSCT